MSVDITEKGEQNPGFFMQGTAANLLHKTFLLTGSSRGGTSFLSSLVANMGLYMGARPEKYENFSIVKCLNKRAPNDPANRALINYIASINRDYNAWGVKVAGLHQHFATLLPLVRNPAVIAIYRDPFAMALRKQAMGKVSEIFAGIQEELREYSSMSNILVGLKCPVLVVSYEKSFSEVDDIAQAISAFTGLPLDLSNLKEKIAADHDAYVTKTRAFFSRVHSQSHDEEIVETSSSSQ